MCDRTESKTKPKAKPVSGSLSRSVSCNVEMPQASRSWGDGRGNGNAKERRELPQRGQGRSTASGAHCFSAALLYMYRVGQKNCAKFFLQ